MKNQIKKLFSGKNKHQINSAVLNKFFIKFPDIKYNLEKILREEPNWGSVRNVFFSILFDEKLNKCKTCGKTLKYQGKNTAIYCCQKCANNDPEIIEKANKSREITCLKKYGVKCNFSCEDTKNKIKQTCLKKYGVESPTQNEIIKNKQKKTLLKNYGVDNIWKLQKIQEKCRQTQIKNGGIGFQRDYIKKNAINFCMEKYGVDNPWKAAEIIEKIKIKKFNNTYNSFSKFSNKIIPLFSKNEFDGCGYYDKKYKWKCVKCGNEFYDTCFSHIPRCLVCEPLCNGYSKSEVELKNFVQSFFPNADKNKTIIKPKEIDILIEDIKLCIEYNGSYFHNIERMPKHYHLNKTLECNKKGYRLIHIWEDEWLNNKEIIKQKLINIFNKKEKINFNEKLDFSWFNGFNYKIEKFFEPIIIERQNNLVENCGYVKYLI